MIEPDCQTLRDRAMRNTKIEVRPLSPAIGAEIAGVDLSKPLDDGTYETLHSALLEHLVIFFRDQVMTPDQQVAFAERFGRIEDPHPVFDKLEENPKVTVLETLGETGIYNDTWHTDVTFKPRPAMGTILLGRDVPVCGGDTLFASLYAAYDALSERMKDFLQGLTATHDFLYAFGNTVMRKSGPDRYVELKKQYPSVSHPVIRSHPETGRPMLFVNETFTVKINELSDTESAALLTMLVNHVKRPEFQVRFRWRNGSLAFWDNRCTQHYAAKDYLPHHRLMHRITLLGDAPFFKAA
jgi:taurine dioxygenase